MGNAHFDPTTKEIDFTSINAIRIDFLEHEMFHAFQDQTYGNAAFISYGKPINSYYPPGYTDIEFEQAVFNDIVNKTLTEGTHNSTDANYVANYRDWISLITNNGTAYPKLNPNATNQADIDKYNSFINSYNSFMDQFKQVPGNPYYSPILHLTPNALINMFNSIDPNC